MKWGHDHEEPAQSMITKRVLIFRGIYLCEKYSNILYKLIVEPALVEQNKESYRHANCSANIISYNEAYHEDMRWDLPGPHPPHNGQKQRPE